MAFTLYGYDANPRSRIVRVVAAAEGIPLQQVTVNPRMNINMEEYLAKFPFSRGKIPALEAPGLKITQVMAITWYLASKHQSARLLGDGTPEQAAEVHSWCSWANQEVQTTLSQWFLPLIPGFKRPAAYSHDAVERGKRASLEILETFDNYVQGKEFLVGDHLTLADIFVVIDLTRPLRWVLGREWRDHHPETMRYFHRIIEMECFREAGVRDVELVEEETPNRDPYSEES